MDVLGINLSTIDPNVIYLALVVSLWIAVTAAYVPGTGFIEVLAVLGIGGSLLVLAEQPTNWFAVLLVVGGVTGFIIMPFVKQQYAALAVAGLAAQGIGGVLLFDGMSVSLFLIALLLVIQFAYHQFALVPLLKTINRGPVASRDDVLIGSQGRVVQRIDPVGTVNVNSELWTATSSEPLEPGTPIVVIERDGLRVVVEEYKRKRGSNNRIAEEVTE